MLTETDEARDLRIQQAAMVGRRTPPTASTIKFWSTPLTEEERSDSLRTSVLGYIDRITPLEELSPEEERLEELKRRKFPYPPCLPRYGNYFPKRDPLPPGYIAEVVSRLKSATAEFTGVLDAADLAHFDHLSLEAARRKLIEQLVIPSVCRFIDPALVDCGVEEVCQPLRNGEVRD